MLVRAYWAASRSLFSHNDPSMCFRSLVAAAKTKPVTATTPMKLCNKVNLSMVVHLAKGPKPWIVPQIAMPDATKLTSVVAGGPKRRAAQTANGKTVRSEERRVGKECPSL